MKERPILFSGEMVRAILDGRKTQTRRVVKPQPDSVRSSVLVKSGYETKHGYEIKCPYGQSGDRLWVRETWLYDTFMHDKTDAEPDLSDGRYSHRIIYRASRPDYPLTVGSEKWKPSIHMKREYSRINLEITNIRIERLQDINENDACSEGCHADFPVKSTIGNTLSSKAQYKVLWESINGSGSWDKNPWVWVVEFRRVS